MGFAKPKHPLFTVLRFKDFPATELEDGVKLSADFYQITFKKCCCNKIIYGQFDFDEGVLSFFVPKQTFIKNGEVIPPEGFLILFHPDYIQGTSQQTKIRSYSFFDYSTTIAPRFNLTPKYFSDLIRQHTGRCAQQHIHDKLIDAAKEKLSGTALSVSEMAFLLGFEHSQSFSRLFKLKTNFTPSEYRGTLNCSNSYKQKTAVA